MPHKNICDFAGDNRDGNLQYKSSHAHGKTANKFSLYCRSQTCITCQVTLSERLRLFSYYIFKEPLAFSANHAVVVGGFRPRSGLPSFRSAVLPCGATRHPFHEVHSGVLEFGSVHSKADHEKICSEYGVSSIEKADGGYGKGYTQALTEWRKIINLLQELRDKRNMTVILIAHTAVEHFDDPENPAYDRYTPRLHKKAAHFIVEWADAVFFANKRFRVSKENDRSIASPIGANGGDRVMRTISSPACVAKNRYSLPQELPLSWQAFIDAYTNASGGGECPKE